MKKIPVSKKVWREIHQIKRDKKLSTYSAVIEQILNPREVLKEEIVSDIQVSVADDDQGLKTDVVLKGENQHKSPQLNDGSFPVEKTDVVSEYEKNLKNLGIDENAQHRLYELMSDHNLDNFSILLNHLIDCHTILQREGLHKPQELDRNEKPLQYLEETTILDEIYNHIQELKTPQEHNHVNNISPEKQAFLLDDLSKQYETGRGEHDKIQGRDETGKFIEPKKDKLSSIGEDDVNEKTAKKVNVSDIDEKKEFISCPICYAIRPLVVELDSDGNPLKKHEDGIEYKMVAGVLQRRFSGPGDDYLPFQVRYENNVNIEESMAISTLKYLAPKLHAHILKVIEGTYFMFGGRKL